jgi:hypothetical protein
VLYLYALVDGLHLPDELTGIAGEPLRVEALGSLIAVVGEIDAVPAVTPDALARQDRIVRALHGRASALLPMRFGAAHESRRGASHAVAVRAAVLQQRLEAVRAREQMTIRVVRLGATGATEASASNRTGVEAETTDETGAGRRYLEARAVGRTPRELLPLLEALAPIIRATRVEPARTPGLVATIYHLIDRGASGEYRQRARRAAASLPDLRLRISGPAPCYAFG